MAVPWVLAGRARHNINGHQYWHVRLLERLAF